MTHMRSNFRNIPSYLHFDRSRYEWSPDINYRTHPEKYKVGKGEQGVLLCEPYKSEILPQWKFKNVSAAEESAKRILKLFNNYILLEDFVGADMARKYLQMGFTRARRYANYKGGNKYDKQNNYAVQSRDTGETEKAKAAEIFFDYWKRAENDPIYSVVKVGWKVLLG